MNNIDLMNYWIDSSEEDYKVMHELYQNNRNTYCLFFGQLAIEKLLKALYAKKNKTTPYAPKSHDLLFLAEKVNLKLDEKQDKLLNIITKFNLNARYDDYKKTFYNMCTNEYTKEQVKNIEEVRAWLKLELKINQ